MEPFRLTLEQVTFKEGEAGSDQAIDSFDAVINCNYDSKRSDDGESTYNTEYRHIVYTTCGLDNITQSVGIQVPTRRVDSKSRGHNWYNYPETVGEESLDDFVINADVNFEAQVHKPTPSVTDISTIAQISYNSSAANQYIPFTKTTCFRNVRTSLTSVLKTTPIESEITSKMTSMPFIDTSFDTVAEALHLQRTVIGNNKLTPAPPDVVAQYVAEAERKLHRESESNGSVSSLSETSSQYSVEQIMSPVNETDNKAPYHNIQQSDFPDDRHDQNNSNSNITTVIETKESQGSTSPRELIRIPAQDLFITKERSGKKDTEKSTSKSKEYQGSGTQNFMHDKIIRKTSSERMVDQYNISDKFFLESLSPVKSVDMTEFLPPQKPIDPDPDVLKISQKEDSETNLGILYSSTPRDKTNSRQDFVLPPLEPLFPRVPKPIFNIPRTPVPTPYKMADDSNQTFRIQLDSALKEKARLEGQLEVLTQESNSNLQERAELQAQLASLKLKLLARNTPNNDKKIALKVELEEMRRSRQMIEDSMVETQRQLEEKSQESKIHQDELHVTQDAMDKLHIKLKELRDTLSAKEMTVQALKNKIAELYVEVQNTLQSKSESDAEASVSKNDLTTLINAKEWYQQQLQLAHEVRCSLQKELTILQAQCVSQSSVVERLKMDNTKLRKQLTESQHKALKEKELLAKHLEAIQTDMMDREAAFMEMQGEKKLIEDSFDSQCKTVEDEHSRMSYLMQSTVELESRLEKAQIDAKKKQIHILRLESHQIEFEKKLTLSQEKINEKDGIIEELNQKMIEVDEQVKAFQKGISAKETEILKLKEEKATAEIALNGALKEKAAVDNALDALKSNMGRVEISFKQMRHELSSRVTELESVKTEKDEYSEELERAMKELEIKRRSYDTIHKDYDDKSSTLNEIQIQKSMLESEIRELKKELTVIGESRKQTNCEQKIRECELQHQLEETKTILAHVQQKLQEEVLRKEQTQIVQHSPNFSHVDPDASPNKFQNKEVQVETENLNQKGLIHVLSQTDNLLPDLSQEQQTNLTSETTAEGNENKRSHDSSMNTIVIVQKDIHIQTVDQQMTFTDSSVNTDVIQLTDMDIQTLDEPRIISHDASFNTDQTEQKDFHSQTDFMQHQTLADCSVQTVMKFSDVADMIQQNKSYKESTLQTVPDVNSEVSVKQSPLDFSSHADIADKTVVHKIALVDSSTQTSASVQDEQSVSQLTKETNTDDVNDILPIINSSVPFQANIYNHDEREREDPQINHSMEQILTTVSDEETVLDVASQEKVHEVPLQTSVIIKGVSNDIYEEVISQNTSLKSKVVNLEDNLAFHRSEAKDVISKLSDNLLAVQTELKDRQVTYDKNVEFLGNKLRDSLAVKQDLEIEIQSLQKKYDQGSIEHQKQYKIHLQSLSNDLVAAQTRVQELEAYLLALQESKNSEIIQLQQHITSLEVDLEEFKDDQKESCKVEDLNQQLALELEKERGRLEGLIQNNTSLKQHVGQLEEALARRESSLVELQSYLQDTNKDKELTSEDYIKRVQSLETLLQREKDGQRDLRKQIGMKITENKKLKKHNEQSKQEQDLLKHQVELHEQEVIKLQTELDDNRESTVSHRSEVQSLQSEKKTLQLELEHVQRELTDNIARNPLIIEQMDSLQWQICQKSKEVEFTQNQVKSVEDRQQAEMDLLRQTIQEKQFEIEELQKELSGAKQEKINQKTRVTELRSALKSSVQYHKLTKKMNSKKTKLKDANSNNSMEEEGDNVVCDSLESMLEEHGTVENTVVSNMVEKGVQVDIEDNLVIPTPTYDIDAIETLLEQTAIQTLESKPLDNLQSCLVSLKSQINGLQLSMEVHTTNIHNSNQTASDIEKEVHELQQVVRTVANTTFASLTTNTKSISTEGAQGE